MKIIIDADACPKSVREICLEKAEKYKIEVVMVIDDAHKLEGNFTTIVVGKDNDAVDHKIVEVFSAEDILITQDYGLASILIDKAFGIINPSGFLYTKWNIDTLMYQRHINAKERSQGKRTKGPKKRVLNQDIEFSKVLVELLNKKFSI